MCLVVFAWQCHPRYPLVVAANRDEMHQRPAAPMDWWSDQRDILAGRDLQAGGTWLAVNRNGRFATVTNFRERFRPARGKRSRGELVTEFVAGNAASLDFQQNLRGDDYAGYSLLCATQDELSYGSNRGDEPRQLQPGVYGLSNATLDTPWPKLLRSREGLREMIDADRINPVALLRLMEDTTPAAVKDLDDHLPVELARAVSAPFIKNERYGTRCTSVVLLEADGNAYVSERRFDNQGRQTGEQQFRFRSSASSVPGSTVNT